MPDTVLLSLFKEPIVVIGLSLMVILKLVDFAQRASHRRADQNGNNPVVRELRKLVDVTEDHNDTMKRAHERTQAILEENHKDTVRICKAHVARTDAAIGDLKEAIEREA